MTKVITIYCEGKKGSSDYDILEKVIPYPSIIIKPIGGKRGAKSAVQVHEKSIVTSHFYLLFRDRDFDKAIPDKPQLEQMTSSYEYCSYLNTIENYLFNTKDFFNFISYKKLNGRCKIHSEDDVKKLFIHAAEQIKYYQAVRHTLGKMRTGDTNFGTKWVQKSGQLPTQLDRKFCYEKAWRKIQSAKDIATNQWTEARFEETFKSFIDLFNNEFMESLGFFVYFQGKDFATSLRNLLYQQFPIKEYYKFAKRNFDYTLHPDLVELRELLKFEFEKK